MALGIGEMILYGLIGKEVLDRLPLPEFLLPSAEKGQFKLGRAQLALQEKMMMAQQEAQKTMTKESRKRADETMSQMLSLRREERTSGQRQRLLEMLTESGARTSDTMMALVAALLQSRQPPQLPQPASSMIPSMMNMLRR